MFTTRVRQTEVLGACEQWGSLSANWRGVTARQQKLALRDHVRRTLYPTLGLFEWLWIASTVMKIIRWWMQNQSPMAIAAAAKGQSVSDSDLGDDDE